MFDIRPAALSEFSLLPALEAAADQVYGSLEPAIPFGDFPPPARPQEYAQAFHIMVAGRPPVGFVRLEIVDGNVHMEQLAVMPEYGRRGVGRALVTAARAWAQEAGFHAMTLCTFADVPFNAPFYASCGFVDVPPESLGPELQALRKREAAMGLDSMGPRVTMEIIFPSPE